MVGLTGVLVVLPALINGGIDIYSSVQKLPRTEAERINEKLFREYFGKTPLVTVPVPIRQNNGTVEVRFDVYEKGDIFVQFGSFAQWFPFPAQANAPPVKTSGFSLLSSAIAQEQVPAKGMGRYEQVDQMQRHAVVRERVYENGVVERQVIDLRSGDILSSTTRQTEQKQLPASPATRALTVPKIAPIDLDRARPAAQTSFAK
ncbi:MAG TPA: hypothetical protein VLJ57_20670 [Burkholderiaceae bacterium]|nr:hypothetical protein [Burkholderiaceae bacterium]